MSAGLRIISVTKSLDAYQRGDQKISRYFSATMLCGHSGLFLSSLRKHKRLSWRKFCTLAAVAHLDRPLLTGVVVPWLTKGGFIEVVQGGEKKAVSCNVLDYDAILRATWELFTKLDTTPEERAVLEVVDEGIKIPTEKTRLFNTITSESTESVERAVELAESYKIVNVLKGTGVREPIIYSPLVWGDKISKAGKALSNLKANKRDALLELLDIVRRNQGFPYKSALEWAKKRGHPAIVQFAERIGLLDKTQIATRDGQIAAYLTTPHLYGEMAATHGNDVCDRIRLFLDSIRHGQYCGDWYTGRIQDPVILLDALLNRGKIGPCSAIGTDYIMVEKAGIVNTKESKVRPGRFYMHPVQDDTVRLVRDIAENPMYAGTISSSVSFSAAIHDRFISAEETRAQTQLGEIPGPMKEAEAEIVRAIRETS